MAGNIQWRWLSARLTGFKSCAQIWPLTALMSEAGQRLLVRRFMTLRLRTMRETARRVTVCWPGQARWSSVMKGSMVAGAWWGIPSPQVTPERISSFWTRAKVSQQRWLADEDKIVQARPVLQAQQPLAQAVGVYEVGAVDVGCKHLAGAMHAEDFLHRSRPPCGAWPLNPIWKVVLRIRRGAVGV
jgi:hypothetical protein